jgi:hypothetical protein
MSRSSVSIKNQDLWVITNQDCRDFVETRFLKVQDFLNASRQSFWSVEIERIDRDQVETNQDPQAYNLVF